MSLRVGLYARVSTVDQTCQNQLLELRAYAARRGWEAPREFIDQGVSGTRESRPALDELLAEARRGRLDVVAVVRLDRLGRSLKGLLAILDEFRRLGVELVSLGEALDTASAGGRALFAMIGVFAEFELSLIKERVRAGVARAKAQGKRLGRPEKRLDLDAVRDRLGRGESARAVARDLGVGRATLARALARAPEATAPGPK